MVKLVQVCHRLVVMSAKRSGALEGRAYEDAVGAVTSVGMDGHQADESEGDDTFSTLVLDGGSNAELFPPSKPFLCLDLASVLRGLEVECADEDRVEERSRSGGLGAFLEVLLGFVRDHLVSKNFLSTAAAFSEQGGAEHPDETDGLQETFVMMCEVSILIQGLRVLLGRVSGKDVCTRRFSLLAAAAFSFRKIYDGAR